MSGIDAHKVVSLSVPSTSRLVSTFGQILFDIQPLTEATYLASAEAMLGGEGGGKHSRKANFFNCAQHGDLQTDSC